MRFCIGLVSVVALLVPTTAFTIPQQQPRSISKSRLSMAEEANGEIDGALNKYSRYVV
jgi:hypothetical protein